MQPREDARQRAQAAKVSATAIRLLDVGFERPFINVNAARDHLGVSYVADVAEEPAELAERRPTLH